MKLKKGEVWKINDSRKGKFTAKLLGNVDTSKDEFVDVKIVEGKANFISIANVDRGFKGDTISVRTILCKFVKKIKTKKK